MGSAGVAGLKRQVALLRQQVAERLIPPVVVVTYPIDCPTPRFDKAASAALKKFPQVCLVSFQFHRADDGPSPSHATARLAPELEALYRAVEEDEAAWLGTPGHLAALAAEVQDHMGCVGTGGWWLAALQEDRTRCAKYGVPFPAEAEAILERGQRRAVAEPLALPPGPVARAALPPMLPAPPARALTIEASAIYDGPCVCGTRHTPGRQATCSACGCRADHHAAVRERRHCVFCQRPAEAHWSDAQAGTSWHACGSYRAHASASDGCLCRRCCGFRFEDRP